MGLGRNLDRYFKKKKKKGLKESQREGYLETDRNAGERERVIIITGHHANVGNLEGGSALNGWVRVGLITHVIINKGGSGSGVGYCLKEGSEDLKSGKKRRAYVGEGVN